VERLNAGSLDEISLEDGEDLHVEGERSVEGAAKTRSFPASMSLPTRLQGALQKRQSLITLSNISPMVTREELEEILRGCSDNFVALELGLPMSDKGNYRMGWATFEESADLMPIVTGIEEKIMHGDKIYCSAQKSFSLQFKIARPAFSSESRIAKDLEQAKLLMAALDKYWGIEHALLESISGRPELLQLDSIVLYLRQVHYICYYSGVSAQGPNDLVRLAGDLYLRSSPQTETNPAEGLESFDQSISDLQDNLTTSYDPISEDTYKHICWLML
jgi:hypothetical protein